MTNQGKRLGRYLVQSVLGRGGMGTVFLAVHEELGREVALKVLREESVDPQGDLAKRFLREASSCARLSHPNIVRVFDYGHEQGVFYYAMELLRARDLQELLDEKPVQPISMTLRVARDIVAAFKYYMPLGFIHRDLKPANVMIDGSGRAILTDFGLVKDLHATPITREHCLVGTPAYLAPELLRGATVSPSADIWALGVILYRMLAGRLPFEGKTPTEVFPMIVKQQPPPLPVEANAIPAALVNFVFNCLEKDPAVRYQTPDELEADLKAAERRSAVQRRALPPDASARAAPEAEAPAKASSPSPGPAQAVPTPALPRRGRVETGPASGTAPGGPRQSGVRSLLAAAGVCMALALGAAGGFYVTGPRTDSDSPSEPGRTGAPAIRTATSAAPVSPLTSNRATAALAAPEPGNLTLALRAFAPSNRAEVLDSRITRATSAQRAGLLEAEGRAAASSLLAACLTRVKTAPETFLGPHLSWDERVNHGEELLSMLRYDLCHEAWNRPGPLGVLPKLSGRIAYQTTRLTGSAATGSETALLRAIEQAFPPPLVRIPLLAVTGNSDTWAYDNVQTKRKLDGLVEYLETTDRIRQREPLARFRLPAGLTGPVRFVATVDELDAQSAFLLHLKPGPAARALVLPIVNVLSARRSEAWSLVTLSLGPGVLPPGDYEGWLTSRRLFDHVVSRRNLRTVTLVLPEK
ncbi:MAG: protein kinase [Candidatus Riflebacteria bacterium]|nr:protein kinase [Candidatus Riflebacteria bacterium]